MRGEHAIAIAALFAACTDQKPLFLPIGSARSALVIVETPESSKYELTAFELATGAPASLSIDTTVDHRIYALRFHETLAQLKLLPGSVAVVQHGTALPESDEPLQSVEVTGGVAGVWSEVSALPKAIAELQIGTDVGCTDFGAVPMSFPGTAGGHAVNFALALDADTVLVVIDNDRAFRVTREGPRDIGPFTVPHGTAARDPASGELWIGGRGGAIARGTIEAGFIAQTPIPTSTAAELSLAGGTGPGGFELFASTNAKELWRLAGDTWEKLYSDPTAEQERSRPRAAWCAPGFAIAIGWGNQALIEHDGGQTRAVDIPLPFQIGSDDSLWSVARIEGFECMVGTRYGLLYSRDQGEWRTLAEDNPPTNGDVYVLAGIDGGILFGGQSGVLTQFYRNVGWCDAMVYSSFGFEHLVPLGRGYLGIQRSGGENADVQALWLTRD